jgi:hypothetical protein
MSIGEPNKPFLNHKSEHPLDATCVKPGYMLWLPKCKKYNKWPSINLCTKFAGILNIYLLFGEGAYPSSDLMAQTSNPSNTPFRNPKLLDSQ